jgi:hypothetical protein
MKGENPVEITLEDLGNIGEFIGAIGVVVTLIYLAIQIRQNTASVRTAAGMDTARQMAAWADRMVVHPELERIYNLAAEDPGSLQTEEVNRFLIYMAEIFIIYEGQYQMYRQKQITDDMWVPKRDILLGYLKNPLVETWWVKRVSPFSESFFGYIEKLRLESGELSFAYQSIADTLKKGSAERKSSTEVPS